jgi:hypothetical protein
MQGRKDAGPAPARSAIRDTARMAQGRTEARLPPPVSNVPANLVPGSPPGAEPVETGAMRSPSKMAAASKGSVHEAERDDSDPGVALSPFRRAHPWAAHPQGRFYFPSSCWLALRSSELLYFTSEAEARATGRYRSTEPGCS